MKNISSPSPALRLLHRSREAAAALGISERSLWKLAKEGRIPVVRVGRSVRYDERDLVDFVDASKQNGVRT
jgi:excisionase family DNA binding protein